MRRQNLLHAAGGKPVARDIDDVVGAAHHENIAVLVLVAGIGGFVVAGEFGEIGFLETVVLLPQGRQAGGRHRQLDDDRAHGVRGHGPSCVIDHVDLIARHRHRRRTMLHRELA